VTAKILLCSCIDRTPIKCRRYNTGGIN